MAQLVWSPRAVRDLSRLRDFLAPNNPRAARDAIAAIRESILELKRFPAAGRMTDAHDRSRREWLVPYSNSGYVVRYEIDGDRITISGIRHMREVGF